MAVELVAAATQRKDRQSHSYSECVSNLFQIAVDVCVHGTYTYTYMDMHVHVHTYTLHTHTHYVAIYISLFHSKVHSEIENIKVIALVFLPNFDHSKRTYFLLL